MDKLKLYLPLVGLIAFFVLANIFINFTDWIPSTAWSIGLGLGMGLTVATGVFLYFYKYTAKKIEDDDWAKVMEWGLITTTIATNVLLISNLVAGTEIPLTDKKVIDPDLFNRLSTALMWVEIVVMITLLSVPLYLKISGFVGIKLSEVFGKSSTTPTSTPAPGTTGAGSGIAWGVVGVIGAFILIALALNLRPHNTTTRNTNASDAGSSTMTGNTSETTTPPGYTPQPPTNVTNVEQMGPDQGMRSTFK